ncbi:hypothetical protein KDK95_21360 [Actinospica sp. MGRD01-02]|uniref:Tyr recombinase domain-containing protein n=1 Tax=Actinospica acidithermotolerans TaxID=2828514 RepID=A0A941ECP7_9ACTN|nr:hypothetical protein [Actinospica acidithermotolerans]MBR7828872.1 hypothetical protein [Actinospica acidithermotolerans]
MFLADLLSERVEAVGGRPLLFANRCGEPIRHSDFWHAWRAACDGRLPRYARDGSLREPGTGPVYRGLRFQDLRHTHKTILTELAVPEILQDERLGHRPPGMRRVYDHTTLPMREAMADGLQTLWESRPDARDGLSQRQALSDPCPARGGRVVDQRVRAGGSREHRMPGSRQLLADR